MSRPDLSASAESPVLVVDAFTREPFRGNPAGVVLLGRPGDDGWMQRFAAEMKHAETAFLAPEGDGYHLRWFTPVREVDLCGHATLASAHALWETGRLRAGDPARFRTRSGVLVARQGGSGIEMDFPSLPTEPVSSEAAPAGLAEALGASIRFLGWSGMDFLAELENEAAVRNLKPDFAALGKIGARGVIVTAAAAPSEAHDFVSRFFAPAFGIDEDPVTGSAHCCLGPYWAKKLGKGEVAGYQASPRGGTVRVVPRGDRVTLIGHAVTVLRGTVLATCTEEMGAASGANAD